MNADVLIKARKVFVEHNIVEYSETCTHCASKGLEKKLRYFYISLEEAIYKCENDKCLYPFERFMFKSLSDNSVYYYEEVIDGGREAYLRIPLDGQNDYESKNPISTKVFCDSQRQPNIEDYNCDFSFLFNDFEMEPKPVKESNTENGDFLDFLDDIETKTQDNQNASEVLNGNGFDKMIDDILNESPIKDDQPTTQTTKDAPNIEPDPVKPEPKLSKCIQHIEKVKSTKARKPRDKTKSTLATAIQKARQSRSSSKCDGRSANETQESETLKPKPLASLMATPTSQPSLKPTADAKAREIKSLLKSKSILRPTELAQKLSFLKKNQVTSDFLRQYMKAKEEKSSTTELKTISRPSDDTTQKILLEDVKNQNNSMAEQKGSSGVKKRTNSNGVTSRRTKTDEKSKPIEGAAKKVRRPRSKQPSTASVSDVKGVEKPCQTTEPANESASTVVKPQTDASSAKKAPTKRKSSSKVKQVDGSVDDEKSHEKDDISTKKTESEKKPRKRKSTSIDDKKCKEKKETSTERVQPVKRPRKSNCDNSMKIDSLKRTEIESKPTRKRAVKPKPKSIEIKPSLPDPTPPLSVDISSSGNETKPTTANKSSSLANSTSNQVKVTATKTSSKSGIEPKLDNIVIDEKLDSVPQIDRKVVSTKTHVQKTAQKTSHERKPRKKQSTSQSVNDTGSKKQPEPKKTIVTQDDGPMQATVSSDDEPIINVIVSSDGELKHCELATSKTATKPSNSKNHEEDVHIASSSHLVEMDSPCEGQTINPTFAVDNETNEMDISVQVIIDETETTATEPYYRRKNFNKLIDQSFRIENVLNDWDESETEQTESNPTTSDLKSRQENDDAVSIISIASETSDSCFAFVGEPYYEK